MRGRVQLVSYKFECYKLRSDCSLGKPDQADVHTPKSTKHTQQVQWSQVKLQDEVKSVQLKIQTSLPNVEGNPRSRSNSSIDCQWMNALKRHHVATSPSLQHSRPHSPNTLTHFLPYLHNQDTYAAAVRRTSVPTTYHITPLIQSRSSSPTTYLSSLHLNSKGSSSSSATSTSDSPSERGSSKTRNRNYYHSSVSPGGAAAGKRLVRNPGTAPGTLRNAGKYSRSSQSTFNQYPHMPRTHERKHPHYHQQHKSIPGMPLKTETEEEEEESKVSEGGWVKVNYSKKSYRHTVGKQNKEKPKGTGTLQRKYR